MNKIILSTGDIKEDYEIVDIVFAAQVIRSHFVRTGGRETLAFLPEVNEKLRQTAAEMGCDAVIWIDYDFDRDPAVQILAAYGTGVRIRSKI